MVTPVASGKVSLHDIEQRMKKLELKISRSTAKPSTLDKDTSLNGNDFFTNDATTSTKSRSKHICG